MGYTSHIDNVNTKELKMENAIIAAAQEYSALIGNMTEVEVLEAIKSGNQSVQRSVLALMQVAA